MADQAGTTIPQRKSDRVRAMFSEIAPRYDLLNHTLSFNTDRRWRRITVGKLSDLLSRPGATALDMCCGTGDLSLELGKTAETLALDFCHPMLRIAFDKTQATGLPVTIIEGDALAVPFADSSFDVVTMAFGLRNLDGLEAGLVEILRVLVPGGRAAILEFSKVRVPVINRLFDVYFNRVLPLIGNTVSGSQFAYRYLPDSVKGFPGPEDLAEAMRAVGFSSVRYYNLSFGIAALHLGEKTA